MKPTAAFEWSMQSRALGWVKAWDAKTATYDDEYVSPKQWRVILDATTSNGGGFEIDLYRWEITGLDGIEFSRIDENKPTTLVLGTSNQPAQPAKLAAKFSKALKQLGRYRVTLTVTNKNGEKSDPSSQVIHLQDLLIVSIGDSMASGEGNPDKERTVADLVGPTASFTDPVWTDQRCHRSQHAGRAQAALELESSHRSVTFLSFACSGASLQSGLIGTYDGMEKPTEIRKPLPSQIDAVADAIGDNRTIDMLWITAGLNNLGDDGFSSVIEAFARPTTNQAIAASLLGGLLAAYLVGKESVDNDAPDKM